MVGIAAPLIQSAGSTLWASCACLADVPRSHTNVLVVADLPVCSCSKRLLHHRLLVRVSGQALLRRESNSLWADQLRVGNDLLHAPHACLRLPIYHSIDPLHALAAAIIVATDRYCF